MSEFREPLRKEGKHRFMAGTCVDCGHPLDEICTANLQLNKSEPMMQTETNWECFRDMAYYDMWCVRRVGERRLEHGWHVSSEGEARALCEEMRILSKPDDKDALIAQLREEIFGHAKENNRLRDCISQGCENLDALRAEIAQLTTLGAKPVEQLEQMTALWREYREYSWHSSCNENSLEGDRRCPTCIKADSLLGKETK